MTRPDKKRLIRGWVYGMCLAYVGLFSYCMFPGGWESLWVFAMTALLLRSGLKLDQWPLWKAELFCLSGVSLGVLVRWLVEYGEASWKRNFTPGNILLYLIFAPAYMVLVFHALRWYEGRKNRKTHRRRASGAR